MSANPKMTISLEVSLDPLWKGKPRLTPNIMLAAICARAETREARALDRTLIRSVSFRQE